jgi:hypothetical protein
MKKVFLLISLFASCQLFSQKEYNFDYGLTYSFNLKNGKTNTNIYLVNSKKNNYYLFIHDGDSINSTLHFYDFKGLMVNGMMINNKAYQSSAYISNCNEVLPLKNSYKYQINNYEFVILNDTVLNDTSYYHYKVRSLKSLKFQKRKKILTTHYIVDKSSNNFIPFLWNSTIYEEWKHEKSIPNGYPKIIFYENFEGKITTVFSLVSIKKIERKLTIPNECDYTRGEIKYKPETIKMGF